MYDESDATAPVAAPHHSPCSSKEGACGQQTDLSTTAFRLEEKRYKLYKADPKAPKTLRRRCDTDFSDVVDFRNVEANTESNRSMMRLVEETRREADDDSGGATAAASTAGPAYTFSGVPGLLFFPAAVDDAEQAYWCREALETYTQSSSFPNNKSTLNSEVVTTAYDPALRWATLGFSYDWTNRVYTKDRWAVFPRGLNELMSSLVDRVKAVSQDQFNAAGLYESQTAIVNYFPVGTMMMAHQDVSEVCLQKPLMSMSLGCSCVFLMGTDKREDKPFAFFLRSGDVVAFTGPSRTAYHAVPRILDDCPPQLTTDAKDDDDTAATSEPTSSTPPPSWRRHMRGLRININVRQVYDEHCPFLFTAASSDVSKKGGERTQQS